jgi:hypothetical protein
MLFFPFPSAISPTHFRTFNDLLVNPFEDGLTRILWYTNDYLAGLPVNISTRSMLAILAAVFAAAVVYALRPVKSARHFRREGDFAASAIEIDRFLLQRTLVANGT